MSKAPSGVHISLYSPSPPKGLGKWRGFAARGNEMEMDTTRRQVTGHLVVYCKQPLPCEANRRFSKEDRRD